MRDLKDSEGLKLFEDTTAEERYYARSIKIRMATLELMLKLADKSEKETPIPYETLESLGNDCANWVRRGGWDRKPASTVTCQRWAKQFLSRLGPFKPQNFGPAQFVVSWRDGFERAEVAGELARFRRK